MHEINAHSFKTVICMLSTCMSFSKFRNSNISLDAHKNTNEAHNYEICDAFSNPPFTNCLCTTSTLGCFIDPHRYLIQFLFFNKTLKVLFLHHAKFQQISSSHFDAKRLFYNLNTFLNNGFPVSITYTYFGLPRNFSEIKFVLVIWLCDSQRMYLGIQWRKSRH